MYKDVKKKILAVVLCICMVIGAVEIVPRVQAANDNNVFTVKAKDIKDNSEVELTLTLDSTTLSYSGEVNMPTMRSLKCSDGTDVKGATLEKVTDCINVGLQQCRLTFGSNADYKIGDEAGQINFSIEKAKITDVNFDLKSDIIVWQYGGTKPEMSYVTVTTSKNNEIRLDEKQYEVEPVQGTGSLSTKLKIVDDDNFDSTGEMEETVKVKVAYPLNGVLSDNTTEYEMSLVSLSADYDGTAKTPEIQLKGSNGTVFNISFEPNLIISYSNQNGNSVSEIKDAGIYTVTAAVNNGGMMELNNGCFYTGTFTGTFTVVGKGKSGLRVTAVDEKTNQPVEVYNNGTAGGQLTYTYKQGSPVYLRNYIVYDGSTQVTEQFEPQWEGESRAGLATLTLKPKSGSNYTEPIEIEYFILSDLKINELWFDGYVGNYLISKYMIYYSSLPITPLETKVVNGSGAELVENRHYTLSYYYTLDGSNYIKASGANDPRMATAGSKRIRATGIGVYQDAGYAEETYEISAVNMENSTYYNDFELTLSGEGVYGNKTSGYYVYYQGKEWKPTVTFTYKGYQLEEGTDYDVSYTDNLNAGSATVTVQARDGSNYDGKREQVFTITELPISSAVVSGQAIDVNSPAYYYTGKSIIPVIKLYQENYYEYTLTAGDEYTATYYDENSTKLAAAPTDVGIYYIEVKNVDTKGNIVGDKKKIQYQIIKQDVNNLNFTLPQLNVNSEIEWNGGITDPTVECVGLIEGIDFRVIGYYNDNYPNESAYVRIEGINNYTGTRDIPYIITKRSLSLTSITATGSSKSNGDGTYTGEITVTDSGKEVIKTNLLEGTDYQITSVTYITKEDSTDYKDRLSSLPKAGEYQVVLTGIGNYTGTTTVTIGCGKDISNATLEIEDEELVYDGAIKIPSEISLYFSPSELLEYDTSGNGAFTLSFSRDDGVSASQANIYAGTVYVTAVGNPDQGYYGETTYKATYTIDAMPLKEKYKAVIVYDDNEVTVDDNGYVVFQYAAEEIHPTIQLVAIDDETEILGKRYYDVSYNGGTTPGTYTITATGKGNYTGPASAKFRIVKRQMTSNKIEVIENGGTSYAGEAPTLQIVLERTNDQYELVPDTDYTYDYELTETDAGYRYVYTISGTSNFTGTRTYTSDLISRTTLKGAISEDSWEVGEVFIRQWDMEELLVDPTDPQKKEPRNFTLSYKAGENKYIDLTLYDETTGKGDFKITGYGINKFPGTANSVTVEGVNGYTGRETFVVTLYTNISLAEYNEGSTIQPNGKISLTVLKEALAADDPSAALAELVQFNTLWSDETGGRIDPANYIVTVPTSYTPKIGDITFTIAGTQAAPKYYAGSRTVKMTVTGALDSGDIRIVVDDDNAVEWNGTTVSPGATTVKVFDGETPLRGGAADSTADKSGWDYEYTFTDNSEIGIATVIVTGLNNYSGELSQPFKITYPLSKLKIEIEDENGAWQEYDGGSPSYLYQIDTTQNMPEVRLVYPKDDSTAYVDRNYYSLYYSGYESAGKASILIGGSEEEAYKNVLIGSSRTVTYTLRQIPIDGTIQIDNPIVTYSGLEITAADIGLSVTYKGYELKKDIDYKLAWHDNLNSDAVDGKQASVVVTGMGNFTGTETKEFSINTLPIYSTQDIGVVVDEMFYTGSAVAPTYTVSQLTGRLSTLKEGTDYELVYYTDDTKTRMQQTPFTEVGTYYIVIRGLGNYQASEYRYIEYKILTREMEDGITATFVSTESCPVVAGAPVCVYNGSAHEPAVQVVYNGVILTENTNYEVAYTDNTDAGTATVTITGKGSFSGEKTLPFVITPKDIAGDDMSFRNLDGTAFVDEAEYEWSNNNNPIRPDIAVFDTSLSKKLTLGEGGADYRVDYYDENEDENSQYNAGMVTLTVTGTKNYGGTKVFTYYIGEDISKSYALVNGKSGVSVIYNGLEQAPDESAITVVSNGVTLTDDNGEKRYDIAYYKNGFEYENLVSRDKIVDAGTYYVAIVGVPTKGTYAKSGISNSCIYEIKPRSISPSYIKVSGFDDTYYYTGQEIVPKGIVVEDTQLPVDSAGTTTRTVQLVNGTDYELSYAGHVYAGKATITVTGKGNYEGTREAYFTIISSDVTGNNTWDGTSEGTGSLTSGTSTISASNITLGYDNSAYDCMMYTGYARIPTVSIDGVSADQYTVSASNNINPGVATLVITGAGKNYTGKIIMNYVIKANLGTHGSIAAIADQVYTGYQITPGLTLTCGGNLLNQGSDYTVTYANNINVGTATVIAYAASDSYYIGSITGTFNISNTAGGMQITGYASSYTYSGYPITPDVVVTMNGRVLNRGTDYTVSYSNNINVGTATMTVTGIGSFSGTQTIYYTIEAKNIENCLTTAVTNYQYTGNTYTPNVTITDSSTGKTLVAGTDYTITYSNNTNPGTASITVTALSKNYTGTKVIPFKITSAAVSGLRTSTIKNNSIKLAWSAQDYADGYQICNSKNQVVATTRKNSYTVKGLTSCTTYKFKVRSYVENADGSISYGNFSTAVSAKTLLNTPTLKVKSTSKGKVTLTWTKVTKATGYEIYYSTKKNGVYTRLKTISKSSKRQYVDAGLASGEKYYYTIRAYRTANGVKTYSSYNTIKSVKVK